MGYGSQKKNVIAILAALEVALTGQGYKFEKGAGIAAAEEVYKRG